MMTALDVVMILITSTPDGVMDGAFAMQQDMESCETRLPGITAVIKSTGVTVHESVCAEGEWSFTDFRHSYEEDENATKDVFSYRVLFDDKGSPAIKILRVERMADCVAETDSAPASKRSYCVVSRQQMK